MAKKKNRKNKNTKNQIQNKKTLSTIDVQIEEPSKINLEAEFGLAHILEREAEQPETPAAAVVDSSIAAKSTKSSNSDKPANLANSSGSEKMANSSKSLNSTKSVKSLKSANSDKTANLANSSKLEQAKLKLTHISKAVKQHFSKVDVKKPLNRASHLGAKTAKMTAAGFGELKSACLSNKKCALSAAMAALSLILGLTALLSLGAPAVMENRAETPSAVVNTAEPLVNNHKTENPAKTLSNYSKLAVTGTPLSLGLAQPKPMVLFSADLRDHGYKVGDSCEVSYENSLSTVNSALKVENPFNIFRTVYNLRVNGEIVASFKTPNEGKKVMDEIVARNTDEKSEIIKLEYRENVEVTKDEAGFLEDSTYSKVEDAVNFLMTGTKEMQKYTIVAGDIPETIAESHGMTIDELEAANPSIVGRGHLLQIGEELNLVIPKPLVNVLATERRSYVKNVDYEVVEQEDAEMYEGEVVVEEEGEYGRSEVVAEVVRENGREVSRTILSEKVLKEPKKEIVTVGTKQAPPRRGSGYLDYPLQRGFEVSSPFGMRWGFLHSGIDLACPQGTPIVAADGGIVTFAGWDSLGGLMVKIDHGGNISTGYAHCDYLAVSEGDMVFKGQYIADVGMTGMTTGPHLHFEVLYNGVHTDPSDYLAFY